MTRDRRARWIFSCLALLLPLAWTFSERGGESGWERAWDAVKRHTVWRGMAYRAIKAHPDNGIREALRYADDVVRVTDDRIYVDVGPDMPRTFWRSPEDRSRYEARFAAQTDTPFRAFPEVEGDGAKATVTCNRDTVFVHDVSSTSQNGNNTLDSALNNLHPDTLDMIVFSTGGRVFVGQKEVSDDCWIMAGQTAPGDGFVWDIFRGARALRIGSGGRAENWMVRGMTFHPLGGDNSGSSPDVSIEDATDWVWAESEHWWCHEKCINSGTASDGDTVSDATFWRVFQAEAQAHEPTAHQITDCDSGTGCTAGATLIGRISVLNSLYHSNSHRNPNGGFDDGDTLSVVYRLNGILWYNNANQANAQVSGPGYYSIEDSRVKTGPLSNDDPGTRDYSWAVGVNIDAASTPLGSVTRIFLDDIIGQHSDGSESGQDLFWDDTDQGTDGVVDSLTAELSCYYNRCRDPEGGGNPRDSVGDLFAGTAPADPVVPISAIDPSTLVDELAGTASDSGKVGRWYFVASDGTKTPKSDSVHSALLKHVRDSTGRSSSPDSAYVDANADYTLDSGTSWTDADGDGLPDDREVLEGSASDSTDVEPDDDTDGDGYTSIEEWANGTDPTVFNGVAVSGSVTYGDGRIVHLVPAVVDTHVVGSDTAIRRIPDTDSVPVQGVCIRIPDPDTSHYYAVTYDTISPQPSVLDSATVSDSMTSLGTDRDIRSDTCFGRTP